MHPTVPSAQSPGCTPLSPVPSSTMHPTVPSAQPPSCTPRAAGPQRRWLSVGCVSQATCPITQDSTPDQLGNCFKENKDISSCLRELRRIYITLLLTFPPGPKQLPEFPWAGLHHTLRWGPGRREMEEETREGQTPHRAPPLRLALTAALQCMVLYSLLPPLLTASKL